MERDRAPHQGLRDLQLVVTQAQHPKKQPLLEATLTCIARQGYDGTRLADVSREAGVSVGVLQHYFGTREQLLREALTHASAGLADQLDEIAASSGSAWQRLCAMIDLVSGVPNLSLRGSLWLELSRLATRQPELGGALRDVYSLWAALISETVAQGQLDGSLQLQGGAAGTATAGGSPDLVAVFLAFVDGYEYQLASQLIDDDAALFRRRATLLARQLFRPRNPASE